MRDALEIKIFNDYLITETVVNATRIPLFVEEGILPATKYLMLHAFQKGQSSGLRWVVSTNVLKSNAPIKAVHNKLLKIYLELAATKKAFDVISLTEESIINFISESYGELEKKFKTECKHIKFVGTSEYLDDVVTLGFMSVLFWAINKI